MTLVKSNFIAAIDGPCIEGTAIGGCDLCGLHVVQMLADIGTGKRTAHQRCIEAVFGASEEVEA